MNKQEKLAYFFVYFIEKIRKKWYTKGNNKMRGAYYENT